MYIWDKEKNEKLKKERGVSFGDVIHALTTDGYLDRMENPARPEQMIFVIRLKGYIYAVPHVIDTEGNIILKTAFPNRKLHKKYNP